MPKRKNNTRKREEQKTFFRSFDVNRAAIDEESRTVELAFSSETEKVERWDGTEVLDHGAKSIRLGRLKNSAPLLMDHNMRDQIGVVESVSVGSDRVARAVVRFGKSKRAREIFNDVVDGIRSKVSVGYWRYKRMETDEGTEAKPLYRVTDWEPYEISIVSIAADDDVGIGRDADNTQTQKVEQTMPEEIQDQTADNRQQAPAPAPAPAFDADGEREKIKTAEVNRQKQIRAIGQRRNLADKAEEFINDDKSVDEFRAYVVENMDETPTQSPARHADVDLSDNENREYSVLRAVEAAATGDWSRAGLEREVSEEIAKQLDRSPNGVFVPTSLRHTPEMLQRQREIAQRALVAGTDAAGGYGVQTDVMSLIDLLRNRMMTRAMGARVLSGLTGDLTFPRQASGSAFSWVAENPGSDLGDSDATFEQVAMTPKTGQSTTAYSRQLLAQSSVDVEMLVRDDLAAAAALGIDLAAINGSGASNQPEGILNVTGIGSVVGGANGAAPDWADIVNLESEVAVDNADIGTLGYLTNSKVRGKLKQTEKAANTAQFVWGEGALQNGFGEMNGYRAGVSNQVPSNLTKGTASGICSAIIFGNWNDLMIGEWGALEIITDPYTKKKQGLVEVTSFVMADIAVRHPESFAAMVDALTT